MQKKIGKLVLVMLLVIMSMSVISCSSSKNMNTFSNGYFQIGNSDGLTVREIDSSSYIVEGVVDINIEFVESAIVMKDVESIKLIIDAVKESYEDEGAIFESGIIETDEGSIGVWLNIMKNDGSYKYQNYITRDYSYYILTAKSEFDDKNMKNAQKIMNTFKVVNDVDIFTEVAEDGMETKDTEKNEQNEISYFIARTESLIEDDVVSVVIPKDWKRHLAGLNSFCVESPEGKTFWMSKIELEGKTFESFINKMIKAKKRYPAQRYTESNIVTFNDKEYTTIEFIEKEQILFDDENKRFIFKKNDDNVVSFMMFKKLDDNAVIQMEQHELAVLENDEFKKVLGSLEFKTN